MSGSAFRSVARIGLIGVGALVGGAFGQPALGAAIGGMLGGLLFPEKLPGVSGPRLGDQQFTTSTEGTAIPLVYGRHVVAGNFIWAAPLDEVENTDKQGGKGGPSQELTTYTYFLSFAVALCEGEITGVPRIWENGKLIYDRRAQQDGESDSDYAKRLAACDELDEQLTIYLGDEEQLPDPLIESHEGVGEVSAHRGLAYVVFERRDVTQTGGRPAQYQFEVTRAELIYETTTELTTDFLPDWIEGSKDPRPFNGSFEYVYGNPVLGAPWRDTLAEALADAEAAIGYSLSPTIMGWRRSTGTNSPASDYSAVDPTQKETLDLLFNGPEGDAVSLFFSEDDYNDAATTGYYPFSGFFNLGVPQQTVVWADISGSIYRAGLWYLTANVGDPAPGDGYLAINNCVHEFGCPYLSGTALYQPSTPITVRRKVQAPPDPCLGRPDAPIGPDYCVIDGEFINRGPWTLTSGTFKALSAYSTFGSPAETIPPLGPVLALGDANYDDEAYWTAQYDAAVADGKLPADWVYGDEYPVEVDHAYTRTTTTAHYADYDGTTVGAIVRDQCERSGLTAGTDFDVSELTKIIPGYKVERIMNGRDIIAPLRQYALFDGLETDKLRFPLRGGAIVATLTEDDLGAHEPGSDQPPLVEANRIEDVELPASVRVRYADIDSEYQPGAQLATIKVLAGKSAVDIETTIAMDATAAAQMAEVMLQEAVQRREEYDLKIGPHLLKLTATDPILIPLRGETQRAVITEDTRALPGIIEAKANREDQSIYTSTATGTPGGAGEQTLTPIGDTDLVIIDGPALGSGSNDAGLFIAACGASDRWRGFGLFESTDGGSNYSRIAAYTLPSTMGTLVDAIPSGPYEIWDYVNSFTVAMDHGTLESRTQDEVLNGANAIFVGADGRWEVIQFADAVAEGVDGEGRVIYRLSTLLRGRQGTEWAIGSSQVGDRLVLCVTTNRLTMEVARVGLPRLFKAVSFGRSTESGPTQTFTPQGVALKPYAPTSPEDQRDGSGNLDIYATRRTRIAAEWGDSDYVPLNEDIEAYEVDILDGGSPDTVLRTLSGSSFPITYTAAQQTEDFGSPQLDIPVRIYQISASVGRGYPCEAIL